MFNGLVYKMSKNGATCPSRFPRVQTDVFTSHFVRPTESQFTRIENREKQKIILLEKPTPEKVSLCFWMISDSKQNVLRRLHQFSDIMLDQLSGLRKTDKQVVNPWKTI